MGKTRGKTGKTHTLQLDTRLAQAVTEALTRQRGFFSTPTDENAIALINALQGAGLEVRAVWASERGHAHHVFYRVPDGPDVARQV